MIWNELWDQDIAPTAQMPAKLKDTDRHWEKGTSFAPRTDWTRRERRSGPLLCSRHDASNDSDQMPLPISDGSQSHLALHHASSDLQPQR